MASRELELMNVGNSVRLYKSQLVSDSKAPFNTTNTATQQHHPIIPSFHNPIFPSPYNTPSSAFLKSTTTILSTRTRLGSSFTMPPSPISTISMNANSYRRTYSKIPNMPYAFHIPHLTAMNTLILTRTVTAIRLQSHLSHHRAGLHPSRSSTSMADLTGTAHPPKTDSSD